MLNLNCEYIEIHKQDIILYFNNNQDVDIIHYGTFHELWNHAIFLIGNKHKFDNQLHAFVSLWKKANLFYDIFSIENTVNETDSEYILSSLKSTIKEFEFRPISEIEFYKEINLVLPNIKKAILENNNVSKDNLDWSKTETYWGIFINNNRISDVENFTLPIIGEITISYFLSSKWNDIIIFAETSEQYLYFNWSTGA